MKITKLNSFQGKLNTLLGVDPSIASESSNPIRLKYMGNDIELDGSEEWHVALEKGDTYEFVPAKTARTTPTVIFRNGREKVELKCSMPVLMQLLCGTHFPRGRSKANFMYVTDNVPRRTRLYTAKDCLLSNKWKVTGEVGMFSDAKGNLYLEFNLLVPLAKMMKPTPMQKLRTAFKQANQQQQQEETKPLQQVKRQVRKSTPVSADTVGENGSEIPALPVSSSDRFIAAIDSVMHSGSVWACVAPTAGAARTAGLVLANDARVKADREENTKFSIYKVSANSVLLRTVRPSGTLVSGKTLRETAKFIRSIDIVDQQTNEVDAFVERPPSEIDISHLNVSWSSYDPDKVNMVLVRLFNDGFFSKLKPRATTKGLVFDFSASKDSSTARTEIIGAARRVYQYLHGMLGLEVTPVVRWSSSAGLLRFDFPEQSQDERESIKLLMTKPPLLEAPIYTLDTQPQLTFAVESYDKNTGKVVMWPVRDGHRIGRNPTVVLYTRLRKFNSAT